ncbi:aldehyde dehydrogenase family protein [Verticiella sediminum]|uniref:Aldehyde dehydrogenase n=1 Tax=Verticiella sediminum TaxID=1247510 RepID=A0A556ACR6_9BURK|nr:aldehyde dehydrogenase family protein [Verticiella sediminum]TSH90694.1 aldehyde dehydrogenase family protein [Verticiella sediminum]
MPNEADITRVFELQKRNAWKLKRSNSATRKAKLVRLRDRLMQVGGEVSEALYQDMARPRTAMPFDVQNAIDTANEAIEHLEQWMAPTPVAAKSTDADVNAYVHYEARGVVLIVGPWNFPFHLCFEPLIYAVAAGNSAIVKPSELTPATSAIVTRIIRELFDESEVAVFEGGAEVAGLLLDKPFDHIFLTGSPKVGRIVMAAAARNLASVTLELGGKNPAIIDRNADLDKAAYEIMLSRIMNAGQVCLSIDYVMAPSASVDLLATKMVDAVKGLVYTDGRFDAAKQGRFVNRNNFDRVRRYVDDAVALGARVILGGGSNADELTMEPTILADVPPNAEIMHEEIFGPVVVIVPYDTLQDAIDFVRSNGKPLGSFIFSHDPAFIQDVLQQTSSGGVSVNVWGEHYFDGRLPFGGVNGSGVGRYHSVYGFREFSHERAVFARGVKAA